ncbi:MAG: creatininase family protein [Burkholderiaceae bacterium]|nr:creatininase family protein [Burkholderiaceae bacterium]
MTIDGRLRALVGAAVIGWAVASHAAPDSVWLEDLTSAELRERIAGGTTTVLVPIGGTEQNGAHLVLGKHNVRVRLLAGRIAEQLGDALVAPVLAYVPEGDIDPPTQHMRYAGTLSIPVAAFESVLEGAARSLRRHGFRHVVLLGDHGGYQASLERVAGRLNRAWGRVNGVIFLAQYYRAAQAFDATLAARGYTQQEIGRHAGLADTALAWAVDASLVRPQSLQPVPGVDGDPRRASAELGRSGVEHIVSASVAALRARMNP